MKYFMIAGERSGDFYGSQLISSLKRVDYTAEIIAYGGDQMERAGADLHHHYKSISYMGFWEVILHLRTIKKVLNRCKEDILDFKPDVVILIDYPGFNLRMAQFATKHKLRVLYYISPKLWAWRTSRIRLIKKFVGKMLVIFPFEVAFYEKLGYQVHYVGNPLISIIENRQRKDLELPAGYRHIIAFFPGSRQQELNKTLPLLEVLTHSHADWLFLVAGVDNVPVSLYDEIEAISNVLVFFDANHDILQHADAAVITSGTATLECALFGVPQVVGYKTSWLSYQIAQRMISLPFISLVNILADKEVVKELIQQDFTPEKIELELTKLLDNDSYRDEMILGYESVRGSLGNQDASQQAAKEIWTWLSRD